MKALVKVEKDTAFLVNDSRLNDFDKSDIEAYLWLLKEVATEVTERLPISLLVPVWPPHQMLLNAFSETAPVRTLYSVLEEVLSNAGYSLGVLTTLEVEKHEPTELTVFKAQTRFRVYTLH